MAEEHGFDSVTVSDHFQPWRHTGGHAPFSIAWMTAVGAAADALPIEQVAKRWIVASDPDEAVAQIKPYIDAGLNHLVFHGPGHDQKRFLDLFERDLMPRLRALS